MADAQLLAPLQKLQENIELLESRNAFQDDIIEQLNDEIAIHQQQISELKLQLNILAERIKDTANSGNGKQDVEPPPPHY